MAKAKPTKAYITESWSKGRPPGWKEMKKKQMEYYMGAKLIEVGVNPKDAVYRWSSESSGSQERWTYSAYWGDSKEKLGSES